MKSKSIYIQTSEAEQAAYKQACYHIAEIMKHLPEAERQGGISHTRQAIKGFNQYIRRLQKGLTLISLHSEFSNYIPSVQVIEQFISKWSQSSDKTAHTLSDLFSFSDEQLADIYQYGVELSSNACFVEASEVFLVLASVRPTIPGFWRALAVSGESEGNFSDALLGYLQALILTDEPQYLVDCGRCLRKLRKHHEADQVLQQAEDEGRRLNYPPEFFEGISFIRKMTE